MSNKISIVDALKTPRKAVVALLNVPDKKIYITYTENSVLFLLRTIQELQNNTHRIPELLKDKDKLEFIILEDMDKFNKCHFGLYLRDYHIQHHADIGYQLYNNIKPLNYKKKLEIINENSKYKAVLYIVTGRHKKLKVAEFNDMNRAKVFFDNYSLDRLLHDYCL